MALDLAGLRKPNLRRGKERVRTAAGKLAALHPALAFGQRLSRRPMLCYGLALGFVAAATSATFLVGNLAERPWAFPCYAAIVASAWRGSGPGCVAVILAAIAVGFFWASPIVSLGVTAADLPWFISFVACAVLSLAWSTQRRRAQQSLTATVQQRTADLVRSNAALQVEIAERKAAEEELRRSETLLAQGQQLSRTASWTLQLPGGEMRWSAQLFDILGLNHDSGNPSYQLLTERIHPDDRAAFIAALTRAIEQESAFSCEARIMMPAGPTKYVQALGEIRGDAPGRGELIGTIVDLTERKRTEQALRDAEAELARTLRLATLAELAAAIAHEINQPLAAITANGAACKRSLGHRPPMLDNAREAANCIVADGHRAAEVIARIRALFNKEEPDQQLLDINGIVQRVLDLSRGQIERQRVAAKTEFAAAPAMVMGDPVQLQQVLVNLVANGLEAMSGIAGRRRRLTIRTERSDVEPEIGDGNAIVVTVEDSGSGLEPGQVARIFDSFYTTKPDGVGVGLAISRSIIEAHGGALWAVPLLPCGARIGFTLPAAAEPSP